MSIVSLLNVNILKNPAKFTDPYQFEITFECLEPLKEDLEWKLTYVGSSASSSHDQELDSILVGPVPLGVSKFVFEADPPNPDLIPQDDLVSITVMLLSGTYRDREFVQVGYYVNNEYDNEELRENPPPRVELDHVVRNILAEKPRVTRFNIPWDAEHLDDEFPPEQPDADIDEIEEYGNEEEDAKDDMVDDDEADEADEDEEARNQADADADVDQDEGEGAEGVESPGASDTKPTLITNGMPSKDHTESEVPEDLGDAEEDAEADNDEDADLVGESENIEASTEGNADSQAVDASK